MPWKTRSLPGEGNFQCHRQDTLAEWSKAVDSSSTIFGCVGSNPTGVIVAIACCIGVRFFDNGLILPAMHEARVLKPSVFHGNTSARIGSEICTDPPKKASRMNRADVTNSMQPSFNGGLPKVPMYSRRDSSPQSPP